MSLLEKKTIKKKWIDKNVMELAKLNANENEGNNDKIETICYNAVYIKKSTDYLSRLYYLVF